MEKFLGLVLLFLGLIIILYSLYSSYNIFNAKNQAPEIFAIEKVKSMSGQTQDIEAQLQNLLQEQLKGLLPAGSVPQLLNLMSWSIFAGILIFGGSQISGLGIRLIK